jgi:hypothetical protein
MGAEFAIKSKPGFKKGRDREKARLKEAELFNQKPRELRAIPMKPFDSSDRSSFCDGQNLELNVEHGRIFAYRDGKAVGVSENPPRSVLRAAAKVGGKSLGKFVRRRAISGVVDIEVCL